VREQKDNWPHVRDYCRARGFQMNEYPPVFLGMPVFVHDPREMCMQEAMSTLPPLDEYEKKRALFDVMWRHVKTGFYLKKDPAKYEKLNAAEQAEIDYLAEIATAMIMAEIDPLLAPDPSVEARYEALKRRAWQVQDHPRDCEGYEGCEGHKADDARAIQNIVKSFSGEERNVKLAEWTGDRLMSRIRTLDVSDLPTDFGELFTDVILPAAIAGITLGISLFTGQGIPEGWSFEVGAYTTAGVEPVQIDAPQILLP